ncbi:MULTISPECIES: head GIN domain-containing protein [unclassified Mucilaginibacter]|uniref:head GIN domain-containing protein n=1 Tax=unclassified Mucilaginibacter TaxID=2617802 RepID=UPI0009675B41|nr:MULTISPECIES: head GIN domain-containing protein [unclassified Mucilaginibacter]OJW15384.1 MAG: DUF2807 domain-containing protein [Mucilaginibacter sp. 44-25]PLW88552.1 MAG: DUF2807 domain-containing protein [Mucilaginibacter sp.]HEK19368.1 DUF2807 domain-containing protein [Bacteroidota bacterium]
MKKLKTLLLAAFLLVGAVIARAEVQDRHLSGFNAVNAAGSYDIYITQGSTESVKVDAPADMISNIITEVKVGVLKIHPKSNNYYWNNDKKVTIYVTLINVNEVNVGGSGNVYFKNGLKAPSLKLGVGGSGDIQGKIEVKELMSSVMGSGDINIAGHADAASISVSGSGDFNAQDLATGSTKIRVSGSASARVNVSDNLDAAVTGSGDIHYTGTVKNISSHQSGSGSISRM